MALGRIFREARESKGMTIAQAAEATRILFPVIEGLENEDFRRIAAPIYGRGFIKIYAEILELDPIPLLDDYAELQAGGGRIKTFNRPEPLLPPKPEPVVQEFSVAEQQEASQKSASVPEEPSPTEAFSLEPDEQPAAPRRRNYSFVAESQQSQTVQQPQPPEKNWLFSRDKTKPVFSKPSPERPEQGFRLPKIKLPVIQIPHIRIPENLRSVLASLKLPVLTPLIKKGMLFVSAAIGVLLIISGLRVFFKTTPPDAAARKPIPAQQTHLDVHVKASRIPMPDPYID